MNLSSTTSPRRWGEATVSVPSQLARCTARILPEGRSLPDETWERRHAGLVILLWLHAIALTACAVVIGSSLLHGLAEGTPMVVAALLAGRSRFSRKVRAGAASFGLITASVLLVHLSGGCVEMHFHFFVVVALMAPYQDWVPFSLAIGSRPSTTVLATLPVTSSCARSPTGCSGASAPWTRSPAWVATSSPSCSRTCATRATPPRAAQRIHDALAAPFVLRDGQVTVGASVGICLGTSGRQSAETLVRNADVAMYAAKDGGRGRYAIFEAGMHAAVMRRLKLEADLRQAVEREEFQLLYQPIVALEVGRIVGVEALVRWAHPERGLVPPSEFIAAAEETGLIVPMGRWVLRPACHQARAWLDEYPTHSPVRVSVNLSPKQLQHPNIVGDVAEALAHSGLEPRLLLLEVTESVLMEDTEANIARLHQLKALDLNLAIDDFGTGYSSLSYLRRFPIDTVKIDKSFIDRITDGSEASALARAIIMMGQTLHLDSVAEGIEHAAQFGELRDPGCDLGQGYHFARPLSPEGVGELLGCPTTWQPAETAGEVTLSDSGRPIDAAP